MPTGENLTAEHQRRAHDVYLRQLEAARAPHEQAIREEPREPPPEFQGAQFIAFLVDVKLPKQGDAILQLQIPARYVDFVLPVRHGRGQPLSVDVQLWENYNAARRAAAGLPQLESRDYENLDLIPLDTDTEDGRSHQRGG